MNHIQNHQKLIFLSPNTVMHAILMCVKWTLIENLNSISIDAITTGLWFLIRNGVDDQKPVINHTDYIWIFANKALYRCDMDLKHYFRTTWLTSIIRWCPIDFGWSRWCWCWWWCCRCWSCTCHCRVRWRWCCNGKCKIITRLDQ